jgi:hypothetical protein
MRWVARVVCVVVSTVMSAGASAALVLTDWKVPGDKLVVRDTVTGYDWLKPSVTTYQSFERVASQILPGNVYSGWSIARAPQVTTMLNGSGGIAITFAGGLDAEVFGAADPFLTDLIRTFGPTETVVVDYGQGPLNVIALGAKYDTGSDTTNGYVLLMQASRAADGAFYFNRYVRSECCNDRTLDDELGTWLVRVNPVPGAEAWAVFMSGIAVVAGLARRRERRRKAAGNGPAPA